MKLYGSPTSPYVRKVRASAIERSIADRLEMEFVAVRQPQSDYGRVNPLHRVPALELPDGSVLFDSPVICEYLDWLDGGPRLFPAAGPDRWRALRQQAMGDGILDAAVARRAESLRPAEQQSPEQLGLYRRSVTQTLDALESGVGELRGVSIGTIAVACALGYLDFRFPADEWRDGRPRLAAWHAEMSGRPAFTETLPFDP